MLQYHGESLALGLVPGHCFLHCSVPGKCRTEHLCPKRGHVRRVREILRKTGTDSEELWVGIKLKASVLHWVPVWQDTGFSRALCRVKFLHISSGMDCSQGNAELNSCQAGHLQCHVTGLSISSF